MRDSGSLKVNMGWIPVNESISVTLMITYTIYDYVQTNNYIKENTFYEKLDATLDVC